MSASKKSGGSKSCCVCNNCFKTNNNGTRKLSSQREIKNAAPGTHCCQGCGKPVNHRLMRCYKHGTLWWECQSPCFQCKLDGTSPQNPWSLRKYRPLVSKLLSWWKEEPYEDNGEYISVQIDNKGLRKFN